MQARVKPVSNLFLCIYARVYVYVWQTLFHHCKRKEQQQEYNRDKNQKKKKKRTTSKIGDTKRTKNMSTSLEN